MNLRGRTDHHRYTALFCPSFNDVSGDGLPLRIRGEVGCGLHGIGFPLLFEPGIELGLLTSPRSSGDFGQLARRYFGESVCGSLDGCHAEISMEVGGQTGILSGAAQYRRRDFVPVIVFEAIVESAGRTPSVGDDLSGVVDATTEILRIVEA